MKLLTLISFIIATFSQITFAHESVLSENNTLVKAGEKFLTLLGKQVNVGDNAPNFKVVNNNFTAISLDSFKGKNILISVVPSLDTGVCSIQTKKFNESVANLNENTILLTISNDLPFAQKRFCSSENIDNIEVFSDSVWRDFGAKYGLIIKDMGLLTRAIFVIDSKQKIIYKELVANISHHPDYVAALKQITRLSSIINDNIVN